MDACNHHHHHHHRQQNKLHNYITWSKKGNERQSFLWVFFLWKKKKNYNNDLYKHRRCTKKNVTH